MFLQDTRASASSGWLSILVKPAYIIITDM